MSFGLLVLAFVAALNPCRLRPGLPPRKAAVSAGALVALAAGAVLAVTGSAILDALDVSPESFRLAAGAVLVLEGARTLLVPRLPALPELDGLGASLVPVAFPLLLQPGVVMLALAAGGDDVEVEGIGAFAVGLGLLVLTAALPAGDRAQRLLAGGARLLGALEVAAGFGLAVDAIRDV